MAVIVVCVARSQQLNWLMPLSGLRLDAADVDAAASAESAASSSNVDTVVEAADVGRPVSGPSVKMGSKATRITFNQIHN